MKVLNQSTGIINYCIYPLTISAGIVLFQLMQTSGYLIFFSSYIPVVLAALLITLMELRLPENTNGLPNRHDIRTDALYMLCMQFLLPKLFAFVFILTLAGAWQASLPPILSVWPQHGSIVTQALLMLVLADFVSYWYHRAAHSNRWLWKLHAIHHSPEKLYWLNVSRFHPLEKIAQLSLTSLPFILLGVSEPVLALYLVFYSINGFFQHCNIRLHYGPLNYLISSAELHRWHHSRNPEVSAHNFGNNLSIWDLLFGTWFLPTDRRPKQLGLKDRNFPTTFWAQLSTPFQHRINSHNSSHPLTQACKHIIIKILLTVTKIFYLRPLLKATEQPLKTQKRLLTTLLAANRNTEFGKRHGFATMESYQDFAASVPIQDYEGLRPYIEKQQETHSKQLTEDQPLMYAVTSGTSGQPKYIPVLAQTLQQYRREQALFSLLQFQARPQGFAGKTLALVSPPIEGRLSNGTPFGSVSGHIYQSMPWIFRGRYLIPPEVFSITEYDLKYKIIVRLALTELDITCLAGANPSSFLRLIEVFREHCNELIDSVASGRINLPKTIDPIIRTLINKRLAPNPERAAQLRSLVAAGKTGFCDLWPSIRTVNTWTGGSCGIALDTLKRQLPAAAQIRELGYVATELRITLPIPNKDNAGLPVINHHFFEFIKRSDREAGNNTTRLIDQLQNHQEYYIIVTTSNGLYRYFMNDIVRVDGFIGRTPLLFFVRKGQGVTNITGEKLYENQLIETISKIQNETRQPIPFYLMLADQQCARYRLYLEIPKPNLCDRKKLADLFDRNLSLINIEYQEKRASQRLKDLRVTLLQSGTADAFKRFYLSQGQREAQFKPQLLQYLDECQFPVMQYCQDSSNKRSAKQLAHS